MGLDNVAVYNLTITIKAPNAKFVDPNLEYGNYLRGKIYDKYVRKLTGITLYADYIPIGDVTHLYHSIKNDIAGRDDMDYVSSGLHVAQVKVLLAFLKVCSDNDYGIERC